MELTILVCTLICTVTGVIAVLPSFGFDLRVRGRSDTSAEVVKKTKRAWIALGLSVLSICMSSFAAYYFFHPRILEKIVEKPVDRIVDRIVEKQVPVPCPKSKQTCAAQQTTNTPQRTGSQTPEGFDAHPADLQASPPGIAVQSGAHVEGIANAPNSMAAGINQGTMMQGDVTPQFSKSTTRLNEPANGKFETTFSVQVTSNHTFIMEILITGKYIADFQVLPEPAVGAAGVTVQLSNQMISANKASGSLQNVRAGKYFVTVETTQPDKLELNLNN